MEGGTGTEEVENRGWTRETNAGKDKFR